MPQAALPDLNMAVGAYRDSMRKALEWKDPVAILRCAQILNGCLNEKYKLSFVPWQEFQESIRPTRAVVCPHCKDTHPAHPYRVVRSKWPPAIRGALGEAAESRWVACQAPGPTHGKKIWLDAPGLDFVLEPHSIYDLDLPAPLPPPHRTLVDRTRWGHAFDEWAQVLNSILEDRCRQFRADYSAGDDPDNTEGHD